MLKITIFVALLLKIVVLLITAKRNIVKYISLVFCGLVCLCALLSCVRESVPSCGKYTVAIGIGDDVTKTSIADNGLSVRWDDDDKLALWARNSSSAYTLAGQLFSLYGNGGNIGVFTTTLDAPMAEDSYDYFVCYPVPESLSGTVAGFNLPSRQDGHAGHGADIMVSNAVRHGPLKPTDKALEDYTGLRGLKMEHLVHILNFYMPSSVGGLKGEPVRKIKITMPQNVVGTISKNLSSSSVEPGYSRTSNEVLLTLDKPLSLSTATDRHFASASIFPTSFSGDSPMRITLYSEHYIGLVDEYQLCGLDMQAGHATPVRLSVREVIPYYTIDFTLAGNNLGEPVQKITLSCAEGGVQFGIGGSGSYTYGSLGTDIAVGTTFTLDFEDDAVAFAAFSGKTITATYESEHVVISQNIKIGALSSKTSNYTASMTVPWLLNENFSGVQTFSSDDEYKTSKAGSYSATSFLSGWTGARCGAQAGKCIRIACRRETSADYPARVDSAPLAGKLKSNVNLSVSFDYGGNLEYTNSKILGNGSTGQTCYVGYIDKNGGLKSGDSSGTYNREDNSFYLPKTETSGSYDNTPHHASLILNSVSGGKDVIRIAWRSEIEHKAGTNNCTSWFYIDNVKVQIAK